MQKKGCNCSDIRTSDRVAHFDDPSNVGFQFVDIYDEVNGPLRHRCLRGEARRWMMSQQAHPGRAAMPISITEASNTVGGKKVKVAKCTKYYYIKKGVKPNDFIVQPTCRRCGNNMTLVDNDKDEFYRVVCMATLRNHRS